MRTPPCARIAAMAALALLLGRGPGPAAAAAAAAAYLPARASIAIGRRAAAAMHASSRLSSSAGSGSEGGAAAEGAPGPEPGPGPGALDPFQNRNNVDDQVFSAISGDGGVKVTVATIRNLLNDGMIMHSMTAVPMDALGRALASCLLVSNGMQEEQDFQLVVDGDGPLRGIVSIANGRGEVRGYVGAPALGEMSLQEAVGKGVLKVVKNHPSWPRPYNGIAAIRHSDVDRDVGAYLAESEQRSCALAAATSVDGILCKAAGGYLVEKLPDCPNGTMGKVEENLAELVRRDGGEALPAGLLQSGVTPVEIAAIILDGLEMEPLQQMKPKMACTCSEDRLFRSIRLLSEADVEEILAANENVEARCQFCGKEYRMSPDQVRTMLGTATGDPSKDDDV